MAYKKPDKVCGCKGWWLRQISDDASGLSVQRSRSAMTIDKGAPMHQAGNIAVEPRRVGEILKLRAMGIITSTAGQGSPGVKPAWQLQCDPFALFLSQLENQWKHSLNGGTENSEQGKQGNKAILPRYSSDILARSAPHNRFDDNFGHGVLAVCKNKIGDRRQTFTVKFVKLSRSCRNMDLVKQQLAKAVAKAPPCLGRWNTLVPPPSIHVLISTEYGVECNIDNT